MIRYLVIWAVTLLLTIPYTVTARGFEVAHEETVNEETVNEEAVNEETVHNKTIHDTHDIQQQGNEFLLNATDPYFVFSILPDKPAENESGKASHLLFSLNIIRPYKKEEDKEEDEEEGEKIPMELFFHPVELNDKQTFDPLYRIKFSVPASDISSAGSSIAIALPKAAAISPGQRIRLDIDECDKCRVNITGSPRMVSNTAINHTNTTIIHAERVINGTKKLTRNGKLLDTAYSWAGNDIVWKSTGFEIIDEDPYLVSPILDIDTHTLGGILFNIQPPDLNTNSISYQFFYTTDRHSFIEDASSFTIITTDSSGNSKFVIPLHFLSEEFPENRILEQFRLDIIDSDTNGYWLLQEIKLLHKDQMASMSELIPPRLFEKKQQRATGFDLFIKVIKKVTADRGFTFFYITLLLLTACFFWRQFKK